MHIFNNLKCLDISVLINQNVLGIRKYYILSNFLIYIRFEIKTNEIVNKPSSCVAEFHNMFCFNAVYILVEEKM